MNTKKIFSISFLIVGVLTILEFLFVQGMFTWMIAVGLSLILGLINIILEIKDKNFLSAMHYAITSIALCMGYTLLM